MRAELRKLRPQKAAGLHRVSPRFLKICATELRGPLQQVFNLSLQLGSVLTLWTTSCIIPVPKISRPSELNYCRPVVLTLHLMETLVRLFLNHLAKERLQFPYRAEIRVEDAIIYILHRAHLRYGKWQCQDSLPGFFKCF